MNHNISVKNEGNIRTIKLEGNFADGVLEVRKAVIDSIAMGIRRFILDLRRVTYLNSLALGGLVTLYAELSNVT
jgi:anti-anti-sigma regulatory factor